jgi:hypothetical protein
LQVGIADSMADTCIKCAMKNHYAPKFPGRVIWKIKKGQPDARSFRLRMMREKIIWKTRKMKKKNRAFIVSAFYVVLYN